MKVIEIPNGRLGNGIFRYLASVILQMEYGAERIHNRQECYKTPTVVISDDNYLHFLETIAKNRAIFDNILIMLNSYYQFDVYSDPRYKSKIIQFLKERPNEIIYGTNLQNQLIQNSVGELFHPPEDLRRYEIVIHCRLEDFVNSNNMIHPNTVINIINSIAETVSSRPRPPVAAIVCNKLTTDIEKKYIQYIYDHSRLPLLFESNDVITDFHIMKGARILMCSLSTLSWCAALLSENVETVYLPKNRTSGHQTFLKPIENTIIYDNVFCDKNDLEQLFEGAQPARSAL